MQDYYPFGMEMPGRVNSSVTEYRFGYQGSESDEEIKGRGCSYLTFFRQLDPRLARWISLDPKYTAFESQYSGMRNCPILLNDIYGDTIRYSIGTTDDERVKYESSTSYLESSQLFDYYYGELKESATVYYVDINEDLNKGGEFNAVTNTITLQSANGSFAVIVQEPFHAYQSDLEVYSSSDHAMRETEGDVMTHYVANEAIFGVGGILFDMQQTWGLELLNMPGDIFTNPSNALVQSQEFDKAFIRAASARTEYYKEKLSQGEDMYKGYAQMNSGQIPLAIKSVFRGVSETKE